MANSTILIPADPTAPGQSNVTLGDGTAAAPAYTFLTQSNLGMYRAGTNQLGFSTNGTQALLIDASQNATFAGNLIMSAAAPIYNATSATTSLLTIQNNGVTVATWDKGGYLVPSVVDPSTYYHPFDWDINGSSASYSVQGNNNTPGAVNAVSVAFQTASNMGIAYVFTSSTTAGGYISTPLSEPIVKSATITYQMRQIFYLPALSSSTNRYTAYVGSCVFTGTANNANTGPFAGPYLSYTDNANSGKWVMGSAVNNTRTTANSTVAAASGWHLLVMTLANGVYTYVLDGVTLGTVTDANIGTGVALNQAVALGGMMIIPDGTNFTTQSNLAIDRSDFYVTGLSR